MRARDPRDKEVLGLRLAAARHTQQSLEGHGTVNTVRVVRVPSVSTLGSAESRETDMRMSVHRWCTDDWAAALGVSLQAVTAVSGGAGMKMRSAAGVPMTVELHWQSLCKR